jgi:hypothetical protein
MSLTVDRRARLRPQDPATVESNPPEDTAPLRKTVIAFARKTLSDRGLLDAALKEDAIEFFSWSEAREAIRSDHRPGVNLDVVLQNMAQAGDRFMADAMSSYAFARLPLTIPGEEEPWPLTIALKRSDDGWVPHRVTDNVIPF